MFMCWIFDTIRLKSYTQKNIYFNVHILNILLCLISLVNILGSNVY